jgi:hypothetical protein
MDELVPHFEVTREMIRAGLVEYEASLESFSPDYLIARVYIAMRSLEPPQEGLCSARPQSSP